MQLGVRWRAGEPPHTSVPAELHDEISAQEGEHPSGTAWTLTWLEGRPRCALDDLVMVQLAPSGEVVVTGPGDSFLAGEVDAADPGDDDWLA